MLSLLYFRAGVLADYLDLAKPRVVLLHLVTAAAAICLAAGGRPSGYTLTFTLLGGGLTAAACNVLNCYFDRALDGTMDRTRRRPLPSGRLTPGHALAFGAAAAASGLLALGWFISLAAAWLAAAALVYYVIIYTLWAKRLTRWGAVIGSGAGAFPPLIGWIAVTGQVALAPFLLSAIIALWSPAHFWALAMFRGDEYERAGVRTPSRSKTVLWTIVFSVLLVFAVLLLAPAAGLGLPYLAPASVLGAGFLYLAARLRRGQLRPAAHRLYAYSIAFLAALFGSMIAASVFFPA